MFLNPDTNWKSFGISSLPMYRRGNEQTYAFANDQIYHCLVVKRLIDDISCFNPNKPDDYPILLEKFHLSYLEHQPLLLIFK